jgi:hypothetical protein
MGRRLSQLQKYEEMVLEIKKIKDDLVDLNLGVN